MLGEEQEQVFSYLAIRGVTWSPLITFDVIAVPV
jgi:hypothetical protein